MISCLSTIRGVYHTINRLIDRSINTSGTSLRNLHNSFNHYIQTMAKLKSHKGVHSIIFQKVQEVDLENYDITKFYNDYIWALEKADTQILSSYENLCHFFEAFGNAAALFSVTLFYRRSFQHA